MDQQTNQQPDTRCASRSVDDGQAITLVVIAIALIVSVAVALAAVGARVDDRSRAQTAADAAALAGASGGRTAAAAATERNGARLLAFDLTRSGLDVTVTVRVAVDDQVAVAKASTAP